MASSSYTNFALPETLPECQSTNLTWDGGVPPYQLTLASLPHYDNQPTMSLTYAGLTNNTFETKVNFPSGVAVVGVVEDSQGLQISSQNGAIIVDSPDQSCITNVQTAPAQSTIGQPLEIVNADTTAECTPTSVTWIGGAPPYTLSFLGTYPGFTLSQNYSEVTNNELSAQLPFPAGASYNVIIKDSAQSSIKGGPFVMGSGSSDDCVLTPPVNVGTSPSASSSVSPTPSSTANSTSTSTASTTTDPSAVATAPSIGPPPQALVAASSSPPVKVIVPSVIGGVVLLCLILLGISCFRRRRRGLRGTGLRAIFVRRRAGDGMSDGDSVMTMTTEMGRVEPFVLPAFLRRVSNNAQEKGARLFGGNSSGEDTAAGAGGKTRGAFAIFRNLPGRNRGSGSGSGSGSGPSSNERGFVSEPLTFPRSPSMSMSSSSSGMTMTHPVNGSTQSVPMSVSTVRGSPFGDDNALGLALSVPPRIGTASLGSMRLSMSMENDSGSVMESLVTGPAGAGMSRSGTPFSGSRTNLTAMGSGMSYTASGMETATGTSMTRSDSMSSYASSDTRHLYTSGRPSEDYSSVHIQYAHYATAPPPPVPGARPLSDDVEVPLIIFNGANRPSIDIPSPYSTSRGSEKSLRSVIARFPTPASSLGNLRDESSGRIVGKA